MLVSNIWVSSPFCMNVWYVLVELYSGFQMMAPRYMTHVTYMLASLEKYNSSSSVGSCLNIFESRVVRNWRWMEKRDKQVRLFALFWYLHDLLWYVWEPHMVFMNHPTHLSMPPKLLTGPLTAHISKHHSHQSFQSMTIHRVSSMLTSHSNLQ